MIQTNFKTAKKEVEAMEKKLKERREDLKKGTEPMRRVSTYLDSWVQQNFKTEGEKTGQKWEELQAGGRPIKGGGIDTSAKILQDTGRLRASFLPFFFRDNAGIGSDLPYSETHEEGIGVPKRRILPLKSEFIDTAKKILGDWVRKVTLK